MLAKIWQAVQHFANSIPALRDLRLVAVTYNTKLRHCAPILPQLFEVVHAAFDRSLKCRVINFARVLVDIAYEETAIMVDPDADQKEPLVLVRRIPCNAKDFRLPGLKGYTQHFPWHFTADSCSTRATPSLCSELMSSGVGYVRSYMVSKDIFASRSYAGPPLYSESALRSLGFSKATVQYFRRLNKRGR